MSIYEKAVAYINEQDTDTRAFVIGVMGNLVYISTDIGDLRLHEEEVRTFANIYDAEHTQA